MRFSSRKGFTLIELLISVAIISIVTGMVLVKYSSFDSTVILKSAAYDIAVSIREVQVKSLSQVRSGGTGASFNYPYGISFTPGSQSYDVFTFASDTGTPRYDSANASRLNTAMLGNSLQVDQVCAYGTSASDPCAFTRLDISFRRPEYKALFYGKNGVDYSSTITSAKIKVKSTKAGATDVFVVEISNLGQISVCKKGVGTCT